MIVTELGVMEITDKGILLKEIAPDVTVEQIQEVTEPKLIISENLKTMEI
jgi:acyl CoA:acetate/3-ketoacid CoA transferase beta subunit